MLGTLRTSNPLTEGGREMKNSGFVARMGMLGALAATLLSGCGGAGQDGAPSAAQTPAVAKVGQGGGRGAARERRRGCAACQVAPCGRNPDSVPDPSGRVEAGGNPVRRL